MCVIWSVASRVLADHWSSCMRDRRLIPGMEPIRWPQALWDLCSDLDPSDPFVLAPSVAQDTPKVIAPKPVQQSAWKGPCVWAAVGFSPQQPGAEDQSVSQTGQTTSIMCCNPGRQCWSACYYDLTGCNSVTLNKALCFGEVQLALAHLAASFALSCRFPLIVKVTRAPEGLGSDLWLHSFGVGIEGKKWKE